MRHPQNNKKQQLWNPDLYNKALWFAARYHQGQTIPSQDIPYILHLAQVCQEAMGGLINRPELDGNLIMCCALLHDTVEDTTCTLEDITVHFGDAVKNGVEALTKYKFKNHIKQSKEQQMQDSLRRIRQQPHEVWIVKLADRITNLQCPPEHWTREKIIRYQQEAEIILSNLGSASTHLHNRLSEKIALYQQYR